MQLKIVAKCPFEGYTIDRRVVTLGQKENLMERLKTRPKDFTFEEAEALLRCFSYSRPNKGRTSGSRGIFISDGHPPILLHRPHPRKELLEYQVKQLAEVLEQEGLL